MDGEGVVSPGGVGFDINCGVRVAGAAGAKASVARGCSSLLLLQKGIQHARQGCWRRFPGPLPARLPYLASSQPSYLQPSNQLIITGVRVLRTNLHESDFTEQKRERLADTLFSLIPVGVGTAGAQTCAGRGASGVAVGGRCCLLHGWPCAVSRCCLVPAVHSEQAPKLPPLNSVFPPSSFCSRPYPNLLTHPSTDPRPQYLYVYPPAGKTWKRCCGRGTYLPTFQLHAFIHSFIHFTAPQQPVVP